MVLDVRTAALDDHVQERVNDAVARLGAHKLRARVSPWNGTRCHVLVAAANEKYGHMALLLALRRGTPVIALGEPIEPLAISPLPANAGTDALTRALHERLQEVGARSRSRQTEGADRRPLLCRLSTPQLRGKAINICNSERTLMLLRPLSGRAHATSTADFDTSIRGFQDLAWGRIEVDSTPVMQAMVSRSIEAFLLLCASHGKLALPDYPDGHYQLKTWPDLGSLPDLVAALHIAKRLVAAPASPDELMQDHNFDVERTDVNACLWAWAAADLLQDKGAAYHTASRLGFRRRRVTNSVWSSIARRFGLTSK